MPNCFNSQSYFHLPEKHRCIHYATIDSTNSEARRQIDLGKIPEHNDKIYTWIVADIQTRGKGRQSKIWHSPKGNLYTSCFFEIPTQQSNLTHICFAAGVSLRKAILQGIQKRQCVESSYYTKNIHLKWPNDIMINDKKCAGVLLELYKGYMIVGFGVNISNAPDSTMIPSTCLNAHDECFTPDNVFHKLAISFEYCLNELFRDGFYTIKKEWLKNAYRLGKTIKIISGKTQNIGQFEDIDNDGALILNSSGERKTFFSGDFFTF